MAEVAIPLKDRGLLRPDTRGEKQPQKKVEQKAPNALDKFKAAGRDRFLSVLQKTRDLLPDARLRQLRDIALPAATEKSAAVIQKAVTTTKEYVKPPSGTIAPATTPEEVADVNFALDQAVSIVKGWEKQGSGSEGPVSIGKVKAALRDMADAAEQANKSPDVVMRYLRAEDRVDEIMRMREHPKKQKATVVNNHPNTSSADAKAA